jgi:hypothetical protein
MIHLKRADEKKTRNKSFVSVADVLLVLQEECAVSRESSFAGIGDTDTFLRESIRL